MAGVSRTRLRFSMTTLRKDLLVFETGIQNVGEEGCGGMVWDLPEEHILCE
jgi:hypothetical protein